MLRIIQLTFTMMLITACQPTKVNQTPTTQSASWKMLTAHSTLSFVTTKNKVATEQHSIKFKAGSIVQNELNIYLDLNSVDTLIPIRDQRLRDILFETKTYPTAHIHQVLPDVWIMDQTLEIPFQLTLHGHQKTMTAKVILQQVNGRLIVVNYEPLLVNAKDFAMDDAVNKLTKIAGLQSINYEVLVDFKLTFEKSSI